MSNKIKLRVVSDVWLILGFLIISLSLVSSPVFSAGPKEELEKKGIAFTADNFVKSAKKGDLDTVKLFLNAGMDVNAKHKFGVTALIFASGEGHTDMVKLLLEKGADLHAKDDEGWMNAWMSASGRGHTDTVKLLIEKGADVNAKAKFGITALMSASFGGHKDTVKLLLEKGAKVNAKDEKGWITALMLASEEGSLDTVKLLLEKGANINAKDKEGKTALDWAKEKKHSELVKLLKSREKNLQTGK